MSLADALVFCIGAGLAYAGVSLAAFWLIAGAIGSIL